LPAPSQPVPAAPASIPRPLQLALFFVGCLWLIASNKAADLLSQAIVPHLNFFEIQPLLEQVLLLLFLLGGFSLLSWTSTRSGNLRMVNALPRRASAMQEWQRGAALGWGMLLAAVVPIMLAGDLHPQFWLQPRAWMLALLSLLTLAVSTLTLEVGFRGYLFSRLIAAIHPVAATALLATLYAIVFSFHDNATGWSMLVSLLMGILLSIAYLRTRALWFGWGLHFAWSATMTLLFGLPVAGSAGFSNLIITNVSGRAWFTGGAYGPEAALITLFVVLAAIPVLYRLTRDYAWNYTHEPIVAAGHPMEIPPPAAHTSVEDTAPPTPLVQILGATPTSASTMPVIEEHLRSASNSAGSSSESSDSI
jgi:membrane protease YdiL (CAAX protease family)